MQIRHGLPDHLRAQACELYWLAFGAKLGWVMGPKPKAMAYLRRVMRGDHCIIALQDGVVLGMVGLQTAQGSFAGGQAGDIWAVYGRIGGIWRYALLSWVGGSTLGVAQDTLLIDGFSVREGARGQGVGACLLAAALDYARAQGYHLAQLDVSDTNPRARAFYESHGFALQSQRSIWPFQRLFGFRRVQTLGRRVEG